ncbi:MAG: HDOD domain-containing protein [Proteobacteria bacterium]|nr:HDOD domain-containing protein [Pseudomonadota bacterium]
MTKYDDTAGKNQAVSGENRTTQRYRQIPVCIDSKAYSTDAGTCANARDKRRIAPPPPSQGAVKGGEGAGIRTALDSEGLPSSEALKKDPPDGQGYPPMPQTTFNAHKLIQDPRTNFEDLAKVLETDQAIPARVLRMANSPYYGMSGNVSSLMHASTVLGLKTLEELIVVAGSTKSLSNRMEGYGMEAGDPWQHSLGVAFGSKIIATGKNPGMANDAFSKDSSRFHRMREFSTMRHMLSLYFMFIRST